LSKGWNLITRTINGAPTAFFVFGDTMPPTFTLDPTCVLVIYRAALGNGFYVTGKVSDNSDATQGANTLFNNLLTLPVHTRPDGSQYLLLRLVISDRAGNRATIELELTII
jgi:hypothetical protein